MELRDAIKDRRSIKKFKRDMTIDEDKLYEALNLATHAPNHCLREPWRVVHVPKDDLGAMSRKLSKIAFPKSEDKQESHYNAVTNLGGFLVVVAKRDPRQREDNENMLAVGAFAQNLLLLLHEVGIGTCWKTPDYIFNPRVKDLFKVEADESIVGFLYLTDLEDEFKAKPRKNDEYVSRFEG
ncbi:nitroreductase family protein [Staphylococcus massiliensis]|uniref:Nitroreductase family protein n=1 Tax=Staphylococcus massiliensis S46 TaxID=1229783 RepID=K9AHZ0_9STAP|nr:nitroreductase [Staphylococcus massiliensis]EKU45726.1 nitroreductase family protein [Staphylococcus massiliensis S46]MCG3400420.1 nitroreductase [Staphylococcus massiliensis]MCG3401735.1 nitroreductase [Staphylococcus massiliensis]MCG3413492.1 nitroreductase [Staphylococcus massiliensis]POA01329.1 nitroreductase [Staphylococcus massiliensis CCUG 55927]